MKIKGCSCLWRLFESISMIWPGIFVNWSKSLCFYWIFDVGLFSLSVSWMLIAMGALHTSAYNKFDLLNKLSNDHLIWIVEKMCQMKILIYLPGEWLTTIQIVDKHHFNTFCSYFFLLFALRLFTFCLCNTVFLRFPFNHITTVFLSYFSLLPSALAIIICHSIQILRDALLYKTHVN